MFRPIVDPTLELSSSPVLVRGNGAAEERKWLSFWLPVVELTVSAVWAVSDKPVDATDFGVWLMPFVARRSIWALSRNKLVAKELKWRTEEVRAAVPPESVL